MDGGNGRYAVRMEGLMDRAIFPSAEQGLRNSAL